MKFNQLKSALTLLAFGLISSFSWGQSTQTIKGTVLGDPDPVPFANILIKQVSDSSVAKFGVTDTLGQFTIAGVPAGSYFVQISSVGFENYLTEVFVVDNESIDLGIAQMKSNSELAAVQVVQIRPVIEILPDKTVFNVENTINATGSNGFDLLRKAPGVIIDNSNNIIVEGKSGVQIYIDNKPSFLAGEDLINYLQTLQAADIDNLR